MSGTKAWTKRDCKCGCGLAVYGRAQYHIDCRWKIHAKEVERARIRSRERTSEAKARATDGRGAAARSRAGAICDGPRKPIKRCEICCDLPHRRWPSGCYGCHKPRGAAPVGTTEWRGFSMIDSARKWA